MAGGLVLAQLLLLVIRGSYKKMGGRMAKFMDIITSLIISVVGIWVLLQNRKIAILCLKAINKEIIPDTPFFNFQRIMISIVGLAFICGGVWHILVLLKSK